MKRSTKNVVRENGCFKSMWTKVKIKQAHDLYVTQKLSMEKTARAMHCSVGAVQNILVAKGWNRRKVHYAKRSTEFCVKNKTKILREYKTSSAQALSEKYELSLRGLIPFLKECGVWRYDHKERVGVAIREGRHTIAVQLNSRIRVCLNADVSDIHILEYNQLVRILTGKIYNIHKKVLDPKGIRSLTFHLDHIFSIKNACFKQVSGYWKPRKLRVPLALLCHPANLQIISRSKNSTKHNINDPINSSIADLKARITVFNAKYGDPFENY